MQQFLSRLCRLLVRCESLLQRRTAVWLLALIALCVVATVHALPAVSGDWFRSGNDMIYILPALRTATNADLLRWLHGPWVGVELFSYYRPVTSALWFAEFKAFGEHAASWQIVSLIMHGISVVLLADLLRRIFGRETTSERIKDETGRMKAVSSLIPHPSSFQGRATTGGCPYVAALVGAYVWATRDKIAQTLEWTPAQTDHFAVFFGVASLLTFQIALDNKKIAVRATGLLVAALLAVLALGSKEIAYPLPLLACLLALRSPSLSRRTKVALIVGCIALLTAFVGWRIVAMHGLGFMPGQASVGRSNASPLTPNKWLLQMAKFLLPRPLGPGAPFPVVATLAICATAYLLWRFPQRLHRLVIATAGVVASSFLLGGPEYLLIPDTYEELVVALTSVGLILLIGRYRPREIGFLAVWGLLGYLPLYHVVYNAAGNVTYLPGIYWAMVWTVIALCIGDVCRRLVGDSA